MYKYLCQQPHDRENGWSEELQGVCHDDKYWYFTQNGYLWKFPVGWRLGNKITGTDRSKNIVRYSGLRHHLGDIDCFNKHIFIPVTGDGHPYIAVVSTDSFTCVAKQVLIHPNNGQFFSSLAWCAINPSDGRLYTSEKHIGPWLSETDCSPILVYDVNYNNLRFDAGGFLEYRAALQPVTKKVTAGGTVYNPLSYSHIQGGCFDGQNHLHTTNGTSKAYAKDGKGGIFVFTVPKTIQKGKTYTILREAYSTQRGTFRYQFDGTGDEPEGITFWNLNNIAEAKEFKGVLHAIMLNNDLNPNPDDFFFKHYDRV